MKNKYFLIIKEVLLTRSNIEWSAMFLGFALIWMISGTLVKEEEIIETYIDKESTVRVIDQTSQNFTREILIKGFAEADKKVELKAETSGRVIALPIKQGTKVKQGDPICSIFMAEKESFFKKAELEYKSAQKLFDEGLCSSNQFQNIKSNFERAKLELDNATIKAPFAGIVDRISLDEGKVSFISSSANSRTHTFRVEVTIENKDGLIKDGSSARIYLPGEDQLANLVPLSILRLDDKGDLGIRIVGDSGTVQFVNVNLIQDTEKGAWISGLPRKSRIITVGQDYVSDGEKVEVAIDDRLMSDERIN